MHYYKKKRCHYKKTRPSALFCSQTTCKLNLAQFHRSNPCHLSSLTIRQRKVQEIRSNNDLLYLSTKSFFLHVEQLHRNTNCLVQDKYLEFFTLFLLQKHLIQMIRFRDILWCITGKSAINQFRVDYQTFSFTSISILSRQIVKKKREKWKTRFDSTYLFQSLTVSGCTCNSEFRDQYVNVVSVCIWVR